MKIPRIKIIWDTDDLKVPAEIRVTTLSNGYILGRTYYKDEEDFVKALAEAIKNPYSAQ